MLIFLEEMSYLAVKQWQEQSRKTVLIHCKQEDVFKVLTILKEILMDQWRGHQGGASCIQKSLMDISDQPLRLLKRSLKIHWEALLIRQTLGVCSLNCSALGQNCREKIERRTSYQSRAFVPLTLQRNGCKVIL